MHDTKSRGCLEEIVGRNKDIKGDSGESSERKEKSCRESFCCLRKYIRYHEQNIARNTNVNDVSVKVSDRILDTDTDKH